MLLLKQKDIDGTTTDLHGAVHEILTSSVLSRHAASFSEASTDSQRDASTGSIQEEDLLGDASQSFESFLDITKSEDELLSSYIQSPTSTASISESEKDDHTNISVSSVDSSVPNFIEKVAFTQRLKSATSSLSSWVFSPRKQDYKVQWFPDSGKAKVMHNVACSPMPQCCEQLEENIVKDHSGSGSECLAKSTDIGRCVNEDASETSVDLTFNPTNDIPDKVSGCGHSSDEHIETCVDCSISEHHEQSVIVRNLLECVKEKTLLLDELDDIVNKSFECSMNVQQDVGDQNVVETHSVMTSPLRIEGHDIAVQHEVETQSAQCSPFRPDTHNVSAQYEADSHSVMCSPMKFDQNDVSIQNCAEFESVMCSPFIVPVLDVSIQNVVGNQSVSCSPMVPRSDQDKSVLAMACELTDQCVGTETRECTDAGVSVQPDQQSVHTQMDCLPMVTTATCMTPIKMDKKNGKK